MSVLNFKQETLDAHKQIEENPSTKEFMLHLDVMMFSVFKQHYNSLSTFSGTHMKILDEIATTTHILEILSFGRHIARNIG